MCLKLTNPGHGFFYGCTDEEACHCAGISESALYEFQKKNRAFLERKQGLKNRPVMLAKKNIVDQIKAGNVKVSWWYLERKAPDEFSTKYHWLLKKVLTELVAYGYYDWDWKPYNKKKDQLPYDLDPERKAEIDALLQEALIEQRERY